jgi:hypothetical protein
MGDRNGGIIMQVFMTSYGFPGSKYPEGIWFIIACSYVLRDIFCMGTTRLIPRKSLLWLKLAVSEQQEGRD